MGRAVAAVVAAYLLWTVLWLGFTSVVQSMVPDLANPDQQLTHMGLLLGYLACSVVISVASGFVCAAVRRGESAAVTMKSVWVLALILLASGVVAEVSYWATTPVWYHLVFLALLVPSTLWGGRLKAG